MELATYTVMHTTSIPHEWPADPRFWSAATPGRLDHFYRTPEADRPDTRFRLLWSDTNLYLRFDVADQHVLCEKTQRQDKVYEDSCVEFFVMPADYGHVNLEMSANGTFLSSHILNPTRTATGFVDYRMFNDSELDGYEIHSSITGTISPERHGPINWWIAARIPLDLLRVARGTVPQPGQTWRANFYKCAENSSHRHWGSWADIGDRLDFHQPARFGKLVFR